MGLISDYLEQNREKTGSTQIDPCMILGNELYNGKNTDERIYQLMEAYRQAITEDEKREKRKNLCIKITELEEMKAEYLLEEKITLSVINRDILQSVFFQNLFALMSEELHKSYHLVCDMRQRIDKEIGEHILAEINVQQPEAICAKLLKLLTVSLMTYIHQSATDLDTSEFRKIVADLAELIKITEKCNFNQPGKKIVRYYLENELGIKETQLVCCNCHSRLLEDLPYCLNCYERN